MLGQQGNIADFYIPQPVSDKPAPHESSAFTIWAFECSNWPV